MGERVSSVDPRLAPWATGCRPLGGLNPSTSVGLSMPEHGSIISATSLHRTFELRLARCRCSDHCGLEGEHGFEFCIPEVPIVSAGQFAVTEINAHAIE